MFVPIISMGDMVRENYWCLEYLTNYLQLLLQITGVGMCLVYLNGSGKCLEQFTDVGQWNCNSVGSWAVVNITSLIGGKGNFRG